MAITLTPLAPFDGEAILPLALAKKHLKIEAEIEDEDDLVRDYRASAIDWVERRCAEAFTPRLWRWTAEGFSPDMRLPIGPVTSVESVSYLNKSGALISLDAATYRVAGASLYPAAGTYWPAALSGEGSVIVTFEAGHALPALAPTMLAAMKMLLGHLYRNRDAVVTGTIVGDVPLGVTDLCDDYRQPVFG